MGYLQILSSCACGNQAFVVRGTKCDIESPCQCYVSIRCPPQCSIVSFVEPSPSGLTRRLACRPFHGVLRPGSCQAVANTLQKEPPCFCSQQAVQTSQTALFRSLTALLSAYGESLRSNCTFTLPYIGKPSVQGCRWQGLPAQRLNNPLWGHCCATACSFNALARSPQPTSTHSTGLLRRIRERRLSPQV
jgi:hypothetical protein